MSDTTPKKFATTVIHSGPGVDPQTGALWPPIVMSSTFAQEAPGKHQGFEYSRTGNPTRQALEKAIADLEGGAHGLAFASGCAATSAVVHLLQSGDHIVAGNDLYGGTYRLFTSVYAVLSYCRAAARDLISGKEPVNLREAFVSQFGEKLFDMFFRRYTEKVWGCPCEEISSDWVSQRSKGLSILTTIKDAIIKSRDVVSLVDEFVYPRDGYQRICEVMARDIESGSGTVHLSSPVKRLVYNGPHDFTLTYDTPDGDREQHATDVISTIPATHLVRMMEPKCPQAVTDAANSLRFRDLITATVMLKKEQVTPDTWLYVHDEDLLFARLHEPKNWSAAMVPGPEYTSVVCECFCSRDDELWQLSDEQIKERVVADLADKLDFIDRSEVLDVCIIRTLFAYPVYDLDYHTKVTEIYGFVNQHEGLHLVGRGGTFRYNNADHSVEMGQLLAKRLLGEDIDHMSVNTAQEYHEEIRNVLRKVPGEDSSQGDSEGGASANAG